MLEIKERKTPFTEEAPLKRLLECGEKWTVKKTDKGKSINFYDASSLKH